MQAQAVGSLRWDYNHAGGDKAAVTCYEWTKWFLKTSGQARRWVAAQTASAKSFYRAPQVAQWLRNHLAMQGTWARYPVGEQSPHMHGATKPACHKHRARVPWSPCTTTSVSRHRNRRSHVTRQRSHTMQLRPVAARYIVFEKDLILEPITSHNGYLVHSLIQKNCWSAVCTKITSM